MLTVGLGSAALLVASAGIGVAAGGFTVVDGSGVIHACVTDTTGAIRVVNASTPSCHQQETAVKWNVRGPRGDIGARGPQGPVGPPGTGSLIVRVVTVMQGSDVTGPAASNNEIWTPVASGTFHLDAASSISIHGIADITYSSDAACGNGVPLSSYLTAFIDLTPDHAFDFEASWRYVYSENEPGPPNDTPSRAVGIEAGPEEPMDLGAGDHTVRLYLQDMGGCTGSAGTATISNARVAVDAEAL